MESLALYQSELTVVHIKIYNNKEKTIKIPMSRLKVKSIIGIFAENRLQVHIFLLNFTEIAIIITIIQKWLCMDSIGKFDLRFEPGDEKASISSLPG